MIYDMERNMELSELPLPETLSFEGAHIFGAGYLYCHFYLVLRAQSSMKRSEKRERRSVKLDVKG